MALEFSYEVCPIAADRQHQYEELSERGRFAVCLLCHEVRLKTEVMPQPGLIETLRRSITRERRNRTGRDD